MENTCFSNENKRLDQNLLARFTFTGFLQVREKWKKSGNLSGQGEIFFLEKLPKSQGKWKIGATRCKWHVS